MSVAPEIAEFAPRPVSDGRSAPTLAVLLEQQSVLTAVERFAAVHAQPRSSELQGRYRELLPLTPLRPGEQYAFEVDLDACSGCKACVSACNHLNGLEPQETWRSVGQVSGMSSDGLPVLQHVTTACHHCLDPACQSACPTNAYDKDPVTGIVRHLDDQCFGCQYCVMACPYEVPRYSPSKGIVRKCDMCSGRLAAGEPPACVQACPSQAIRIRAVPAEEARAASKAPLVAGAPPSDITSPTTVYRSQRQPLPPAADDAHPHPQHAHPALVVMLVLTQMAVGAATAAVGSQLALSSASSVPHALWGAAIVICGLGLAAVTAHLGRPHLAWRGILGWRHSWLSREAIAFGVFAPLAAAAWLLPLVDSAPRHLAALCGAGAVAAGWLGVFCSIRLYQFTRRPFWSGPRTALKFLLTAVMLGAAALGAAIAWAGAPGWLRYVPLTLLACATPLKLATEWWAVQGVRELRTTRAVMRSLWRSEWLRIASGLTGGVALPVWMAWQGPHFTAATHFIAALLSIGLLLGGELIERTNYFRAVVPLRMPGGIAP